MTVDAPRLSPESEKGRARWWIWGTLLAVVLLMGALRIRLAPTPMERDEGEYAYTGQLMLQGIPPYQDSYFMKLPGTHAMYAIGMALFGQTREGIHLWLMVINSAAIVFVFLIGRKLADDQAGLIAAASYAVMSLSPCVLGPVAHATQFVVLFALAGIFVLCRALESRRAAAFFLSGLMFGLAFLMKQPGAFFAVLGFLMIIWEARRVRPIQWRSLVGQGVAFATGLALPYVAICLLLWRLGVFDRFWFWTVTCVRDYGTALPLEWGWRYFHDYFVLNLDASMVLWALGLAGAVCVWKDRRAGIARVIIPALLLISAAAVSQGMYFRPHYFVMLLPAFALALGVGAGSLRRLVLETQPGSGLPAMMGWYVAAALLVVIAGQWKFFFVMSPDEACRRMYSGEAFVETVQIAHYIKEHTKPGDRIAVIGSEPQIYFYSRRRSVSGYIYTYNMMEGGPFAQQMQRDFINQVEAARPEYLVFVQMPNSWGITARSDRTIMSWAAKFCGSLYDIVGEVDFLPDKPGKFFWGKDAAAAPVARECFYVLKRKSVPR